EGEQQQEEALGGLGWSGSAVAANTVPALPVARAENGTACRLELSEELFGGVAEACGRGRGLDRSRCCPVLAAWLFAAHARSALEVAPQQQQQPQPEGSDAGPMMPDDNQRCVDALERALERRQIRLARPNATCDAVICFCGIRLHQITSLRCPAAFDLHLHLHDGANGAAAAAAATAAADEALGGFRNATPTPAVRDLERSCRNASYAGCTRCIQSLQKVKGQVGGGGMEEERGRWMMGRDCQLMGLTWLLARNKTAFIPTVSAVLRAMLYTTHPPSSAAKCSPDQENMPLAVDSLQFQHLNSADDSIAAAVAANRFSLLLHSLLGLLASSLLLLPRPRGVIF
ncbi:putative GPI-anchored protein, partial [Ananas comosus]